MPFPESQRVIYRNNPLVDVICQLRFPTILEIGVEDPAKFQNAIRAQYPIYHRDDSSSLIPKEISGVVGQLRLPSITNSPVHNFKAEDEIRSITLSSDFVAVSDKEYIQWEDFSDQIELARGALEANYDPTFYTRLGLRYQDVIDREELGLEAPWPELINPALLGVLGNDDVGDDVDEYRSEALLRLHDREGSFVKLRSGLFKSPTNGHLVYRIDADFFTTERSTNDDAPEALA